MKRLFMFCAYLALSACATIGNPETPQQKLYAALSVYEVAVTGAADYATSPGANKSVVKALDSVVNSNEAQLALNTAQGFVQCDLKQVTVGCERFTGSTLNRVAALLRVTATQLLAIRSARR